MACEAGGGSLELPRLPGEGFITGQVTRAVAGNERGEPLVGAEVGVFRSNRSTLTDSTGAFSLGPLPPGTYRLLLRANVEGEVRQRFLEQVTVGGGSRTLGEVQLQQNGEVVGRVRFDGTVAGSGAGTVVFAPGLFVTAPTLPDGSYLLRGVPEGLVSVAAYKDQMDVAQVDRLEVVGGQRVFATEMVLRPIASAEPGIIEGDVERHGGATGVIQVSVTRAADPETIVARATAENDGRWRVRDVPPGVYTVQVELDGAPSATIPNVPVGSGRTTPITGIQLFPAVAGQTDRIDDPVVELPDAGTPDGGDADGGTPDAGGGGIGDECRADRDCDSGRLCLLGRCSGCEADSQCRAGFVCRAGDCVRSCGGVMDCPSTLACIGGTCTSCETTLDCRDPLVCADGTCRACEDSRECPFGRACVTGVCQECANDFQCGAGFLCERGRCTAGECRQAIDCPEAGQACEGGACVSSCTARANCRPGRVCDSGECKAGNCVGRTDCAGGELCSGNVCGPCTNDVSCGSGELCLAGRCTRADCRRPSDCTDGLTCLSNRCVPCAGSADCATDFVCSDGACVAGDCLDRGACDDGRVCTDFLCSPCPSDEACAAGELCLEGRCTNADCRTEQDCGAGELCTLNFCVTCASSASCGTGRVCVGGSCVAGNCTARADCDPGLLCNATSNLCEPCASDDACADGELCAAGLCVTGVCHTSADCDGGARLCEPTTRTCVPCSRSAECGEGRVCWEGSCRAGACTSRADCSGGRICNTSTFACEPCAEDGQCIAGERCYAGACLPGTCITEADCTGGALCSSVSRTCVPCTDTTQCGTGRVCVAGGCRPGNCTTRADCGPGLLCPTATYACEPCATDDQCGSGERCYGGQCLTGTCKSGAECAGGARLCDATTRTCVACTRSSECGSDRVCVNGDCLAGDCVTRADCDPGEICSATRRCGACGSDDQCAAGERCYAGACLLGECKVDADCGVEVCNTTTRACEPCTSSSQCGTGRICEEGSCFAGNCGSSADCTAGQVCVARVCTACTADAQCAAGRLCLAGACAVAECRVDADCPSPKACKANACVGNCRSNADCTGGQVCQPSGLCAACTAHVHCGSGKVCAAGACVTGNCAIDADCAPGSLCNAATNSCYVVAPQEAARSTLAIGPGMFSNVGTLYYQPLVGRQTVYYTGSNGGVHAAAVDATTLATKWTVPMGTSWAPSLGIVVPAKGHARGGEVFIAGRQGIQYAFAGGDGELLYSLSEAQAGIAAGFIDGVVHVAWQNQGGAFTSVVRYDGTVLHNGVFTGSYCSGWRHHPVWIADGAFVVTCANGIFVLDAKTLAVRASVAISIADWSPMSFWRAPSGPGMLVIAGTVGGVGKLLAYDLTATSIAARWTFDVAQEIPRALPLVDAHGHTYYFTGNGAWLKLDRGGLVLARGTGGPIRSAAVALSRSGEVLGVDASGRLVSMLPTSMDGGSAFTTRWTLAPANGTYRNDFYPSFTPAGDLLAWQAPISGPTNLTRLRAADGLPLQPPTGTFQSFRGASSSIGSPVSTECNEDADCAANKQCVLGACIGECRTADQCTAGFGCVNGWCTRCGVADGCRANESCHAGACYACDPGSETCCRLNSDCALGSLCVAGKCAPQVTPAWNKTSFLTAPSIASVSTNPDGTRAYLVQAGFTVHAFDRDGTALWGTPATLPVSTGTVQPVLVTRHTGDAQDTLYWMNEIAPARVTRISGAGVVTTGPTLTDVAQTRLALGTNGSQRLLYYVHRNNQRLHAVDADTLAIAWSAFVGCTPSQDAPLVGSDATVYLTCVNGSVQAWHPNGDPDLVVAGLRQGRLLWATPSRGWFELEGWQQIARPLGSSTDFIWMQRRSPGPTILSIVPVSAAGPGTIRDSVSIWRGPTVIDRVGNAYVSNGWEGVVAVIGLDGVVKAWSDMATVNGREITTQLDANGVLYMAGNQQRLEAWQVSPTFTVTKLWETLAPAHSAFDAVNYTLLPGGRLLADSTLTSPNRTWHALDLPGGAGPMPAPARPAASSGDGTWRHSLSVP